MKFLSKLTKETLVCSELQVKYYKDLLKCSYGDEPDVFLFVETLCDIFSVITNKPAEYFKHLSLIDLFCLLLDVRINSNGQICKIIITKNSQKMTLELDLEVIRDSLREFAKKSFVVIDQTNTEIKLECPSINRLMQESLDVSTLFIKSIAVKSPNSYHEITVNEHAQMLYGMLPPNVSFQINDAFESFIKSLNKINFLSRYGITEQELTFNLSVDSFIWYTKLIFNEPLNILYDNIFYLSHLGHLDANYIENSAVGEYTYFIGCLQSTLAAKNPPAASNDQTFIPENDGLSDETF